MQIMFVWFTDTGDSFLSAQVRSSHLLNSSEFTAKTLKVKELQSAENVRAE